MNGRKKLFFSRKLLTLDNMVHISLHSNLTENPKMKYKIGCSIKNNKLNVDFRYNRKCYKFRTRSRLSTLSRLVIPKNPIAKFLLKCHFWFWDNRAGSLNWDTLQRHCCKSFTSSQTLSFFSFNKPNYLQKLITNNRVWLPTKPDWAINSYPIFNS